MTIFILELFLFLLLLLLRQTVAEQFFPSIAWLAGLPVVATIFGAAYAAGYNRMHRLSERHLLMYIMAGKVMRIILFALIFLIYGLVDHSHIKGYAVAVVTAALIYMLFDTLFMLKHKSTPATTQQA